MGDDYFFGYEADERHPHMASTGSEGRCDLCGQRSRSPLHKRPLFGWREKRRQTAIRPEDTPDTGAPYIGEPELPPAPTYEDICVLQDRAGLSEPPPGWKPLRGVLFSFGVDIEPLAESAHNEWLAEKKRRGCTSWPNERGFEQMVPYDQLEEDVKEFDRVVVRAMLNRMGVKYRD